MRKLKFLIVIAPFFFLFLSCKKEKAKEETPVNTITSLHVSLTLTPSHPFRGNKVTLTIRMSNSKGLTKAVIRTITRDSISLTPIQYSFTKTMTSSPEDTSFFFRYIIPQGTKIGDTLKFITSASAKNSVDVSDTNFIIIETAYNPISKWTTPITLFGQNFIGDHYFSTLNDSTFDENQVYSNAGVIDISYGVLSASNGNESFISPAARVSFGFSPIPNGKTTYFSTSSITPAVFDILLNDSLIRDIPVTLADSTVSITSGNVYEFINFNQKRGFIKVNSLNPGIAGNVVFEVKVQK